MVNDFIAFRTMSVVFQVFNNTATANYKKIIYDLLDTNTSSGLLFLLLVSIPLHVLKLSSINE